MGAKLERDAKFSLSRGGNPWPVYTRRTGFTVPGIGVRTIFQASGIVESIRY